MDESLISFLKDEESGMVISVDGKKIPLESTNLSKGDVMTVKHDITFNNGR